MNNQAITVEAIINAPIDQVWKYWTQPEHIMQWCHASDDWHAPAATNDLQVGGHFSTTMAAKDGSFSFDFNGEYTRVNNHEEIAYTMEDGRKVEIKFVSTGDGTTTVTEVFEPESENSPEMQRAGWQSILDTFKRYVESQY